MTTLLLAMLMAARNAEPPTLPAMSALQPELEADPVRLCRSFLSEVDRLTSKHDELERKLNMTRVAVDQRRASLERQRRSIEARKADPRQDRDVIRYDESVLVEQERGLAAEQRKAHVREQEARAVAEQLTGAESTLVACRSEATSRAEGRGTAAPTRPLAEIQVIPEQYQIAEERERLRQAAEDQRRATEERIAKRQKEPKWMRPVLSASLCWAQRAKDAAMTEIAAEKTYARVGGVQDLKKLYALQQDVRQADAVIAAQRKELTRLKVGPLPCGDALVRKLLKCVPLATSISLTGSSLDRDRFAVAVGAVPSGAVPAQTSNPDADSACRDPSLEPYLEVAEPLGW